ncbi:hypothetical protein QQ045_010465 [Rhodiola kirilowii]
MRKEEILSMLSSKVSKPLRTDGFTAIVEKLAYARVLIEIYASNEIKSKVWIKGPRGTRFYQKIEYEWVPPRYKHCHRFGHLEAKCPLLKLRTDDDVEEEDRVLIEPEIASDAKNSDASVLKHKDEMQKINEARDVDLREAGLSQESVVPETLPSKMLVVKKRSRGLELSAMKPLAQDKGTKIV